MYGLIKMLGNRLKSGPQEQSQRGKNIPSQRNLSLRKSPAMEINCLKGNGPEWFMHRGSLWFSQRARFHEGERKSIYRCMPAILILTLFTFWLFSFFSSHSFLFLFPGFSSPIPISSSRFPFISPPSPLFTARPFFIVSAVTRFYCFSP